MASEIIVREEAFPTAIPNMAYTTEIEIGGISFCQLIMLRFRFNLGAKIQIVIYYKNK